MLKIILSTVIFSIFLFANNIDLQMNKLKVKTALIVPSQAVDEYPLWSKDTKSLYSNVMGKWYKIDLTNIQLAGTKWRKNKSLGVINSKESISPANEDEIKIAKKHTNFKPREYITKNKIKFELKSSKLGTQFIITKDDKQDIQWTSRTENCHSISSNEKEDHISFICEMNGVFIYKIK